MCFFASFPASIPLSSTKPRSFRPVLYAVLRILHRGEQQKQHAFYVIDEIKVTLVQHRCHRCLRESLQGGFFPTKKSTSPNVRFKHWKFFGENGLPAGEEVSVWIYENTLKVEHQATTLSLYSVRLDKNQQITEVKNARRLETHFRSPQLDLWRISDTEWLLALRRPAPIARKKPGKVVVLAEQLVLPEFGATG